MIFFLPSCQYSKWVSEQGWIFPAQKTDKMTNLHLQISVRQCLQSSFFCCFCRRGKKLDYLRHLNTAGVIDLNSHRFISFQFHSKAIDPYLISIGMFLWLHVGVQKPHKWERLQRCAGMEPIWSHAHQVCCCLWRLLEAFFELARVHGYTKARAGWGGRAVELASCLPAACPIVQLLSVLAWLPWQSAL